MTSIAVLIPVLNRPGRVQPLVDSILAAGELTPCRAVFVVSPDDDAQEAAVYAAMDKTERVLEAHSGRFAVDAILAPFERGPGDYARKINLGVARTDDPFVLLAADDLVFHPGWAERALAAHLETGACVVGTNDLGNQATVRGTHATHPLVSRAYVGCGTIDEPDSGKLLHEGYDHNFCDTEFCATAFHREVYAHAYDSIVEHLHPLWRKGDEDSTYELGRAGFADDRSLFQARSGLWA